MHETLTIKEAIYDVSQRITAACERVGRNPEEVTLIAVSKTKPVEMLQEVLLPFLGTTLGASSVFFIKGRLSMKQQKIYNSFGAGLMAAASIFNLLLPALEGAKQMGRMSFIPAITGFWIGILFFAEIDRCMRKEYSSNKKQSIMTMILALVLHNIPEGMAVGVVYAGAVTEKTELTITGAFILSLGIAIQNFPEGALYLLC